MKTKTFPERVEKFGVVATIYAPKDKSKGYTVVPDAWINTTIRDHQDGEIGKVGYEINFNRYFYQYQPPRPLGEIGAEIKTLEGEIMAMLKDITQ
jgi:hypothetical protein